MRLFVPWMLAATIAAIPFGRGTTAARAHPDFTGTWTLDPAKSEGPMVPTSATLKVTQDEKSMKVERTTTAMGMTRTGHGDLRARRLAFQEHGERERAKRRFQFDGRVERRRPRDQDDR